MNRVEKMKKKPKLSYSEYTERFPKKHKQKRGKTRYSEE